jgi:hypothetical protein
MRTALILAAGFGALGAFSVYADPAADLASARQRWAEQGSDHYSFTISNACFCAPASRGPRSVTVVDGEVGPSHPLEPFKASRLRTTVPLLFERIEEALRRFPTVTFQLEFDPIDGHPTRFAYDDPAIDDDEIDIVVEDFKHYFAIVNEN